MSQPQHNRPVARDRLARALKRNMARRKGVGKVQSLESSEASTKVEAGLRSAPREPLAAGVSSFSCEGDKVPFNKKTHEATPHE